MNVGLIIHPVDMNVVRSNCKNFYPFYGRLLGPVINLMDDYRVKALFTRLPTHKFMKIKLNDKINVFGIMVPLFPANMVRNRALAIKRIEDAFSIAQQLRVDIVTLAAFTSIVSNGGDDIENTCSISYTSGNALTAKMCIEGIEKSASIFGKTISDLRVAVIGATGDIGSICSDYFASKCKHITLCSRSISGSNSLVRKLTNYRAASVSFSSDVNESVAGADIVLSVASSFGAIFDASLLKKGVIICDAGMPPNFANAVDRDDIFIFEGGKTKLDCYDSVSKAVWKSLFPINSVYGCFAEALTLASANRIESFSTGKGSITIDMITEIGDLANRSGIRLADFSYHGKYYTDSDIEKLKLILGV